MTTYPTNVVPYNKIRYNTPNAPTGDDVIVAYRIPSDMVYLLTGAVSTLQDVNNWREHGSLTQQEAVDVFVNEVERVDICELVAECIRTSTDVQSAIANNGGAGATTIINNTIYSNQVLVSGDLDTNGCSNDAKFGRIVALINYIDTVQSDFFQSVDAATNIIEEVANIVNAIPLIETLPFDNLIQFIGTTGEKWEDSYTASVNTQLKEAFACELWCEYGQAECDITIKDVREAIERRYNLDTTQGQLNALTAANMIARIATTVGSAGGATYIGDDFVYISWLLQIAAVELTGQFFGVDIVDYANSSSNQPTDTAWSSCSCVTTWTYTFNAGTGWGDWTVVKGDGQGSRVEARCGSNPLPGGTGTARDYLIQLDFVQSAEIISVELTYDRTLGANPIGTSDRIYYDDGSSWVTLLDSGSYAAGNGLTLNWSGSAQVSNLYLYQRCTFDSDSSCTGNVYLTRAVITGIVPKPDIN